MYRVRAISGLALEAPSRALTEERALEWLRHHPVTAVLLALAAAILVLLVFVG